MLITLAKCCKRGNVKREAANRKRTVIQRKQEFSSLGRAPARPTLGTKLSHARLGGSLQHKLACSQLIQSSSLFSFKNLPSVSLLLCTPPEQVSTRSAGCPIHQQLSRGRGKQAGSSLEEGSEADRGDPGTGCSGSPPLRQTRLPQSPYRRRFKLQSVPK